MDGEKTDGNTKRAKKVPKIFPQIVEDGYETPDDQPVKVRDNITCAPVRPKNTNKTEDFPTDIRITFPKIKIP